MIKKFGCLINLIFTYIVRHIHYSLKSNPTVNYEQGADLVMLTARKRYVSLG